MKAYFIYMMQNHIDPKLYPGVNPSKIFHYKGYDYTLYAFSEDKERIEFFKNSRDMTLFVSQEKKMSREELVEILSNDKFTEFYLEPWALMSERIGSSNNLTSYYIQVLMTQREYMHIFHRQDMIFGDIISEYDHLLYNKLPSTIFRKEYQDALELASSYTEMMMPENDIGFMDDSTPWRSFKYNMMALYCNQFKNTYIKGDIKCESGNFLNFRQRPKKKHHQV